MTSRVADKRGIALDTNKLKRLRENAGLTQDQAAKLAGMPNRQRWNDIESGRKANVTLSTLDAICSALKCSAQDLLK